jgi:alanyl-tRNA synthetase
VETQLCAKPIYEKDVGSCFLDFYRGLGYQEIPGSSLLDDSVPMSFVMSAGMVQFERLSDSVRDGDHFVLIQNSFRYFDLEQVGNTDMHLSLFRMPGAFDFGPIDHQRTISQIWTLLTEKYGFEPKSLYATYFRGDQIDGQEFPPDNETMAAWQRTGLPPGHLVGLPAKFNFWRQTRDAVGHRNSRKRGPNTEVFFDRGREHACSADCFPGCACGRFIEFLNTLFITHGMDETTGLLEYLAEPFTEVVIGLERVAAILQGKRSVFEIDTIYPLIQQVRCFSKPLPIDFKAVEPTKLERVLVDHLRALLFLTADGAPPPGKGGRARLMRILIREFLTSQRLLGISDRGFVRSMILTALEYYPQVAAAQDFLLEYVSIERARFERTVQAGMSHLENRVEQQGLGFDMQVILSMEKEKGLPSPLIRYQLWQKLGASAGKNTKSEPLQRTST